MLLLLFHYGINLCFNLAYIFKTLPFNVYHNLLAVYHVPTPFLHPATADANQSLITCYLDCSQNLKEQTFFNSSSVVLTFQNGIVSDPLDLLLKTLRMVSLNVASVVLIYAL